MSNEGKEKVEALLAELATQRDELKLQAHLLKAEVKDEWDEVEKKWDHIESVLGRVGESAKASSGDIGAAAEQLGEEIARAYKRIKDAI